MTTMTTSMIIIILGTLYQFANWEEKGLCGAARRSLESGLGRRRSAAGTHISSTSLVMIYY